MAVSRCCRKESESDQTEKLWMLTRPPNLEVTEWNGMTFMRTFESLFLQQKRHKLEQAGHKYPKLLLKRSVLLFVCLRPIFMALQFRQTNC